ncbi:TetR/AcrR family transcriptional regulator [Hymenobacter sp. NST-14]|uniref:TetR/AcrR family transcriptional regulator n=1 Tax=Hymenobacter piscis TaxID=2839984 RepID=UPI001C0383A9|nr:TetR/AcrR family transcriptional regulator [Hymenobacter piscis]MBT9394895.1 TetR/AcrR family transcriptional regulator [Hymenobacter piscis]
MKEDPTAIWLQAGYDLFAATGPAGLKVEVLARRVGISKSSFYHHFADLEVFIGQLLRCHVGRARQLARREAACGSLDPELITVLLEHRTDLLFQRQLRVHRRHGPYAECLAEASGPAAEAFLALWARELPSHLAPHLLGGVFQLALENFYLQLTEATLTREWLSAYFGQLTQLVRALSAGGAPALDGGG